MSSSEDFQRVSESLQPAGPGGSLSDTLGYLGDRLICTGQLTGWQILGRAIEEFPKLLPPPQGIPHGPAA